MNLVDKPGARAQRRKRLSRREFAQLMLDQEGRCYVCQEKLQADAIIDEHLVPLDQCGTNELSNRALLCRPCAREKTRTDQSASAHGRRVRGETGQLKRKAERRAGERPPSFATHAGARWKRKVTGEVVRRKRKRRRIRPILHRRSLTFQCETDRKPTMAADEQGGRRERKTIHHDKTSDRPPD